MDMGTALPRNLMRQITWYCPSQLAITAPRRGSESAWGCGNVVDPLSRHRWSDPTSAPASIDTTAVTPSRGRTGERLLLPPGPARPEQLAVGRPRRHHVERDHPRPEFLRQHVRQLLDRPLVGKYGVTAKLVVPRADTQTVGRNGFVKQRPQQ